MDLRLSMNRLHHCLVSTNDEQIRWQCRSSYLTIRKSHINIVLFCDFQIRLRLWSEDENNELIHSLILSNESPLTILIIVLNRTMIVLFLLLECETGLSSIESLFQRCNQSKSCQFSDYQNTWYSSFLGGIICTMSSTYRIETDFSSRFDYNCEWKFEISLRICSSKSIMEFIC
jgi:hypothetical protein